MTMGKPAGLVALALVLAALSACGTISGSNQASGAAQAVMDVGQNLVGEPCRLEPAEARSGAAQSAPGTDYNLFCGTWERPSGGIVRIAATGTPQAYLSGGTWRERLDRKAFCEPATESSVLDGVSASVLDCKLRNGGWPYVAFATNIGGAVYLADGIPAAQPVLETGVGRLSGKIAASESAGSPGSRSAAVRRLEAGLAGRIFGAGDIGDYQSLTTIARYYHSAKRFGESEKRWRDAVAIHERVLGAQNPELGDPMMHLALDVSNQERFAVADDLFRRAAELIARASDPADKARFISYLALHAANQRQYDKALGLAREATALRRKIAEQSGGPISGPNLGSFQSASLSGASPGLSLMGSDTAAIEIAQSLYTEAGILERLHRYAEAKTAIDEALAIVRRYGAESGWWHPQILELRGRIEGGRRSFAAGERDLQEALTQRMELFPAARPVGLAQLGLGRVYAEEGREREALEAFRAGARVLREEAAGVQYSQILPYIDQLWAAAERDPGQRDALYVEMFDAAQLVRSSVTEQNISDAAVRLAASERGVGSAIRSLQDAQRQRDTLLFNYNRASARATTAEDRQALEDLRAQIAGLEAKVAELEPQVQAAAPRLNLLREQSSGFDQLVGLLRPGEALVQVLTGEPHSYVFLVRDGKVDARKLALTENQIKVIVAHLRTAFTVKSDGGSLQIGGFDVNASHLLYRRLFGSFGDRLDGLNHLVTVQTGSLASLPFGVLVTSPAPAINGSDYSHVNWLARTAAISVVPSVRSFVDLRGKALPSRAPRPFLGFGDFIPVEDPGIMMRSRGLPRECLNGAMAVARAPRLPETADQVRTIARIFGASADSTVLGSAFTEDTVRRMPLDQYRVLAFATHALLPGEVDCLSEPALLTSRPAKDSGDDGLLTYSEVFNLRLDADVVVLSACNTGGPVGQASSARLGPTERIVADLGEADRARGESLTGLARAFFFAGARSLLVSHWEVYTDATVELVTRTVGNGGDNAQLAAGLRAAQLRFIENPATSHPYLWASFTLIGDGARSSAPATLASAAFVSH